MLSDLSVILSSLSLISIVDILLVALVFFWILNLLQGTQAVQLLRGILILSVLAVISASVLNTLTAFSWLVDKALPALLVAIPIIFQPELRRALERVGRTSKLMLGARHVTTSLEDTIEAVCEAATVMSEHRHGALIVFERETGLEDHIETGVRLDATVTPNLLTTIFYPGTALHDGSVIIRGSRLVAAAAVLPLNSGFLSDGSLGTRHRAALGITEISDAIAVTVSEETSLISVAHDGKLISGVDQKRLEQLLKAFFKNQLQEALPAGLRQGQSLLRRLRLVKSNVSNNSSQSGIGR